jgi:Ca-activated chloride channel homolog
MERQVRIVTHRRTTAAVLFLLCGAALHGQPARGKVHQGNKLYAEKKYDAALAKYTDALLENPNSHVARFNAADAAYKKNNWDKALEAFGKTLRTEDILLQSKSHYNMGNAFYRKGRLDSSIQAYEQALKLDPKDRDAKYNLEFVRAKLKENAKPQNQQQQQQQQNQQKQQDKQKQQEQKKEQNQQQANPQERKTEMTKEQAEQLMNALNEDRKKAKQEQVQSSGGGSVEKDW